VIALVVAGAALVGDGGEEGIGERSGPAPARPEKLDVERIKRRVERLRGLRFRRPLAITFASPRRAQTLIREATAGEYSRRETLIDEEALKLIGLLAPSARLERYLRAVETEQVIGFYDERSKRLVVVREGSRGGGFQEITLAHELVHALEDQHFGIEGDEGFNDDRGLADSALFEGTATALMIDYAARFMSTSDAFEALDEVGGAETKLPAFVEDLLLFPYLQGARFVNGLRIDGRWAAVNKVIRYRRPRTTEHVLHLDKYATGERGVQVAASGAGPELGRDWKRLDVSAIGELDLRLLFEYVGDVTDREASAGWDGGRFELWRRRSGGGPCRGPCVGRDVGVIGLVWDSARDRVEAQAAFEKVFERGLKGERLAARRGNDRWSSRGGAIAIAGTARMLTVVLAPSVDLAARVLASAPGTARPAS